MGLDKQGAQGANPLMQQLAAGMAPDATNVPMGAPNPDPVGSQIRMLEAEIAKARATGRDPNASVLDKIAASNFLLNSPQEMEMLMELLNQFQSQPTPGIDQYVQQKPVTPGSRSIRSGVGNNFPTLQEALGRR